MEKISTKKSLHDVSAVVAKMLDTKQDVMTFDSKLSETSVNPVENRAIFGQFMTDDDIRDLVADIDPDYAYKYYRTKPFTIKNVSTNKDGIIRWGKYQDFECSFDGGGTWGAMEASFTLPCCEEVMVRKASAYDASFNLSTSSFHLDVANFEISGNIMSLLYGSDFIGKSTIPANAFKDLFSGAGAIVSAENLVFEFEDIPSAACRGMFKNLGVLAKIPDLSRIKTIADNGCYEMFYNCIAISTPVVLNITSACSYCCYRMFYNCYALVEASLLTSPTLTASCFNSMFANCSKLHKVTWLCDVNNTTTYTNGWMSDVPSGGIFTKKAGTSWPVGTIPNGWLVIEQ